MGLELLGPCLMAGRRAVGLLRPGTELCVFGEGIDMSDG